MSVIEHQAERVGKYQPYPEYNNSGYSWMAKIPSGWLNGPLKRIAYLQAGFAFKGDTFNTSEGVPIVRMNNILNSGGLSLDDAVRVPEIDVKPEFYLATGDIVMGMSGSIENIAKVQGDDLPCALNQRVGRFVLRAVDDGFLWYLIQSNGFKQQVSLAATGTAQLNISSDQVGNTLVSWPVSLLEQNIIAAFLDYETARIDRLIAQQQQLIELLKEKRQAVISHAVKPRPNEKHVKISYVIDLLTGFPFPSSEFKQSGENIIRLLRGVNVGVDQVKWDDTVFWDSQDCDSLKGYHLQCGDIVFGMDRPWISNGARVAEISNDDMPCLLLQRVARIRANHLAYQSFIKLCLASNEFRAYVEADLTGVSVPHISPEQIKNFIIRDLCYEEQVSVTTDALNKLEKLRIIEQTALNAIELIQERRTALISAAVTGKIDLRGWQPPKSEVAA